MRRYDGGAAVRRGANVYPALEGIRWVQLFSLQDATH